VPHDGLKASLLVDEGVVTDTHALLHPPRAHIESFLVYVGYNSADPIIPLDGTHITTGTIGFLPTSRGSVTLNSTNPADPPVIDPNYLSTEADRFVIRTALKNMAKALLETEAGKGFVLEETAPDGFDALTAQSSDKVIDARAQKGAE
jgi:hypothetical protein